MNTNKVIMGLLDIKYIWQEQGVKKSLINKLDIAIKFLQRGEKTEAMHKEIREIFEHNHMTYIDKSLWDELEQKHFPEGR